MTKFKPGESGNPAGRPKENPDLRKRLKALAPKAIDIMEAILDADNIQLRDKYSAAKMIIERTIPAETTEDLSGHDDGQTQIDRLAKVLVRQAGEKPANSLNQSDLVDFQAMVEVSEVKD